MMWRITFGVCAFAISIFGAKLVHGAETISGPVEAQVVRVIDGDTVVVNARVWPQLTVDNISVRVFGIDTPERHGKCDLEKQRAQEAKTIMSEAFEVGSTVNLTHIVLGKFAGRVVANVTRGDNLSWSDLIVGAGLAAPYFGQGAKKDWCADG